MSERALRRLWLAGLWLLVPWPLVVFGDAFVPAARYTLLAAASLAVAVAEGSSGPVALILGLLSGMAVATTLGCWLLAFGVAKLLHRLPPRTAARVTAVLLGAGLVFAVVAKPYTTAFGRAPMGGLLEILS